MGRLTTHVLDTARGVPAAGLEIVLRRDDGTELRRVTTNGDGRTDDPLLEGSDLRAGVYELSFHVGAYFGARGHGLPSGTFLDVVPVRFTVSDASAHLHVPLLVAPYGYSTYRGS